MMSRDYIGRLTTACSTKRRLCLEKSNSARAGKLLTVMGCLPSACVAPLRSIRAVIVSSCVAKSPDDAMRLSSGLLAPQLQTHLPQTPWRHLSWLPHNSVLHIAEWQQSKLNWQLIPLFGLVRQLGKVAGMWSPQLMWRLAKA